MLEKKMAKIKKIICCIIIFAVSAVFTGCHTVKGAGQDIEQGGKAIQREAEEHEN
jgi:predicted small secreted protein